MSQREDVVYEDICTKKKWNIYCGEKIGIFFLSKDYQSQLQHNLQSSGHDEF